MALSPVSGQASASENPGKYNVSSSCLRAREPPVAEPAHPDGELSSIACHARDDGTVLDASPRRPGLPSRRPSRA